MTRKTCAPDTLPKEGSWEMHRFCAGSLQRSRSCQCHSVLDVQDVVHFMVSAYVKEKGTEEAAAAIRRLAAKWLWWWEAQKPDFAPTTLYWTFD